LVKLDSEIVALNVGGTHHMMTERQVLGLCADSTLAKMFSGTHELKKIKEEVFVDRDGRTFQHLVNYLRNNRETWPEFVDPNDEVQFLKELDWWKIPSLRGQTRQTVHVAPKINISSMSERKVPQEMTRQDHPSPKRSVQVPQPDAFHDGRSEDSHGVALKAAKDKWNELGPLRLEDIMRNSKEPIDQSRQFGQSHFNKYILGQLGVNGKVTGVGKEINHIIYEGQFNDDVYSGFGRFIYSNGNYYIGNWLDGKRSGYGKLVEIKTGRVYEG
jgi:hypothetical protein